MDIRQFPTKLKARLSSDVTNATSTFSNISELSLNLGAGYKYVGKLVIKCNNSVAAEGLKLDFNGGSATMSSFISAASVLVNSGAVTLGTVIGSGVLNFTLLTGESIIEIPLSFVVNAGGTFIPRFAEDSVVIGLATIKAGSFIILDGVN